MGRKCCVPNCTSNYKSTIETTGYVKVFTFPKDVERRKLWLTSVHRADLTLDKITNNTVVCINHFAPEFIIKEDRFPGVSATGDANDDDCDRPGKLCLLSISDY